MRDSIRGWSWFINRKQRQAFIEYAESLETSFMKDYKPAGQKPFWQLPDADFARYMESYRRKRQADY